MMGAPESWQERAQDTRSLAEQMDDDENKRLLLEIAGCYDRLAELADDLRAAELREGSP
jgi:hypothetical protein